MSRRYSEGYAQIKWTPLPSWGRNIPKKAADPAAYFMPDVAPFVSPIDRTEITSRSQLREHEKRHGVRQCGELKTLQDYAPSIDPHRNERKLDEALGRAINRHGLK